MDAVPPLSVLAFRRMVLVWLVALGLMVALGGCSVQLAPSYDRVIFDDLNSLNVRTETLFASLSHGGGVGSFAERKASYDDLIGGFSAARLAVTAREVPAAGLRLAAGQAICAEDPAACVNPTPHHLDKIIALLTAMRDAHERGRLVRELVAGFDGQGGFKGQYEIEMSRILVFEAALQR